MSKTKANLEVISETITAYIAEITSTAWNEELQCDMPCAPMKVHSEYDNERDEIVFSDEDGREQFYADVRETSYDDSENGEILLDSIAVFNSDNNENIYNVSLREV